MKKHKWLIIGNILALFLMLACDKDENSSNGTKAVFSYVPDGFLVTFTNFSTNADEYVWDFDDGAATSTLADPNHIFPEKGTYMVSLTASRENETSTFIDTVRIIGPNIKIDGDFSDWEHVGYTIENESDSDNTLLKLKTFASANKINIYVEGTSEMNFEVMNLYIDTDNNPDTGHITWLYPAGSGAEFMGEGNFNPADPSSSGGALYKYGGPGGSDWTWSSVGDFSTVMEFAEFDKNNGNKAMEFAIKKDVLGELGEVINFGLIESDQGYTQIGSIPKNIVTDSELVPIEM